MSALLPSTTNGLASAGILLATCLVVGVLVALTNRGEEDSAAWTWVPFLLVILGTNYVAMQLVRIHDTHAPLSMKWSTALLLAGLIAGAAGFFGVRARYRYAHGVPAGALALSAGGALAAIGLVLWFAGQAYDAANRALAPITVGTLLLLAIIAAIFLWADKR